MIDEAEKIKTIKVELEPGELTNFECPLLTDVSTCGADPGVKNCPEFREEDYSWKIAAGDCPLRRGSVLIISTMQGRSVIKSSTII